MTILEAAESAKLETGRADHPVVDRWLSSPPEGELLEAWILYVEGLCELMDAREREELRHDLLGKARRVAEAAGGFLNLTSGVSRPERRMLETLEEAFTGTACGNDEKEA